MGFTAKFIILLPQSVQADQPGPNNEAECLIWKDSDLSIDFGHITRLEKVVAPRFAHLKHDSFRRAGICVMDCFLQNRMSDFRQKIMNIFAPEILVEKDWHTREDPNRHITKTVGGQRYMKCSENDLQSRLRMEPGQLTREHNFTIKLDRVSLESHVTNEWWVGKPPLLWAACADLANWLLLAEKLEGSGWNALAQDPISVAMARGWYHQLRELGEVNAKAVFIIG